MHAGKISRAFASVFGDVGLGLQRGCTFPVSAVTQPHLNKKSDGPRLCCTDRHHGNQPTPATVLRKREKGRESEREGSLKLSLQNRDPTDADELQASLLCDDHSLSRSSSTPLVLDTQTRLTHHFLPSPLPSIPAFHVDTDVQDLTHCEWAQMAPIAARQSELCGESREITITPDCVCTQMLESSNLVTFNGLANSSSYDTFLLDEERGRLLVGAEDHIFSFDLVNINRDHKQKECTNFIRVLQPYNQTHLYICGTGAFHPICAFLEMGKRAEDNIFRLASHFENGRGKSPYDPKMLSASLLIEKFTFASGTGHLFLTIFFSLADGELYSGTSADFMGRDFAIFRTLGDHHPIRTEQHDSRWLNDPRFIGVNLIPESDNPEDDKIFLFFKENAMDGEHTGKATIARIGQLCKNDMGGHRSLVNKWTTFLKARLMCSVPGVNGIDTHFDELQDVFLMSSKDPKNPVIYAVFTTSSNIFKGSAVCMYNMADIRRVFLGPYAHRDGPNYQWVPFQGRVPYPRPGTCPSKTFGGFDSTKDLPDDVITFARGHPAMYNPVHPIGGRPIMVRTDVDYQFSQLVVDRVEAEDGQYDVMFIGTDMGTVLKVVTIPRESWHDLEEVVLEEMTVFREPTPITAMELSTKQKIPNWTTHRNIKFLRPPSFFDSHSNSCTLARPSVYRRCLYTGARCMGKLALSAAWPETLIAPGTAQSAPDTFLRPRDLHWLISERRESKGMNTDTRYKPKHPNMEVIWSRNITQAQNTVIKSTRTRRQDIRNGDPLSQCSDLQHHEDTDGLGGSVEDRSVFGVENSSMFLECSPKSQRALIYWQLQKPNDDRKHEIKLDDRLLRTDQGLLIRSLTQADTGIYHCQAVEHGFIQPLLRLNLQVIPTQKLGDILPGLSSAGGVGQSAKHRVWYRDFLSLLDHPDLNSVEEFCDRVWKKERKQKRVKAPSGNGQGKPDGAGGSNPALRPKATNTQKQQASPPQSRPWLQGGAPTVEGPARGQNTQKGQQNLGLLSGQAPKNNQKTQNGQKGQASAAGSQIVGGSRVSTQHTTKWRRMQENKKGRNRRTHELQRPPRSV
ncbi:Semaphorin-3aa Semaphorin-1A [Collichthys lucidus]|uniref:Semaphorin-3aa Semaphorin-1A n=1 Tax=Collichthys lucidus TaxID=240159 RepID=A0A4U5TUT0_COLLU|nr:Semaphorin-3aa Semaphorin-1A [Collichthys lucidus]